MQHQRDLFQLPEDIHYLNGAYMSPLLKSVEEAGIEGMRRKRNPTTISPDDFFEEAEQVRNLFAQLVNGKSEQIAIIPSVSYGLMSAIRNLPIDIGDTAIEVGDEFPSDFYAVETWCRDNHKKLQLIKAPETLDKRGEQWNRNILESIDINTAVVVLSSIHWTDGTIFNLQEIGQRCMEVNARFIVDGTQSVGVMPIDVMECKIDALICAGYKWLLGPYSIGLAYYGPSFNDGRPIEEAWVNRNNARNFSALTQYSDEYTPGAGRYNVGEYSHFILMPMLHRALEQILEWKVVSIQDYCRALTDPLAHFLLENDFWVEENNGHAPHMMGVVIPPHMEMDKIIQQLLERKVYVSRRGKAIRISVHVYTLEQDIDALMDTLRKVGKG